MANPYLKESPLLPVLPMDWDTIPTLRELRSHRSTETPTEPFPIFPGVDYCWVLASNRRKAVETEGWAPLRGVDLFTIGGHAVVLMGRGEPIAGARLECTEPVLHVDPELLVKLRPITNDPPARDEKRNAK